MSNPSAFDAVIGTPYPDTIVGNNDSHETLIGGGGRDSLVAGSGNDYLQGYVTQVVWLDFPSAAQTAPGSHVYTLAEEQGVLQGLEQIYSGFEVKAADGSVAAGYYFTLDQATAQQMAVGTGGQYATLDFDAPVVGGAADELDTDNTDLGGTAQINVSGFLAPTVVSSDFGSFTGLVSPTSANIIGLTTTIAAHELGHLSGLEHQDAIGPIGSGIYSGVNPEAFYPALPGVTTTTLSSSVTQVGSTNNYKGTFTATVASDVSGTGTPTGTITFQDATTGAVTVVALDRDGVASTTLTAAAGDIILALYSGDSTFAVSGASQTVGANASMLTLTAGPTIYGENVVFLATLAATGTGTGTPTGTVEFIDATTGTALSTAALVNGAASSTPISASSLTGHDVVAVYSGDSNFAASSASQVLAIGNMTSALETAQDVMSSPDSVGNTLADAAGVNGQTFLGERDLIGLAFNDTGTILRQANLTTVTPASAVSGEFDVNSAYLIGNLPRLAVPNTLPTGVADAGTSFAVTAIAVDGALTTATAGIGDFYAFNGQAGQLMSFQVIANTNTLNTNPVLIPELVVVDSEGQVVGFNVHEFESADSTILDVTLPENGTYYVGVASVVPTLAGSYQLFMYSFATTSARSSVSGDTLVGGSGNDTLVGSSGNDLITFLPGATGKATILAGSGQDTVNATLAPGEQLSPTGFVNIQAMPTVTAIEAGGTYNGSAFTATATVAGVLTGVDNTPSASLEGVTPTLTYYAGSSASGTPLSGAPVDAGTYTVVASFAGSADYVSANSTPVTFTISPYAFTYQIGGDSQTYGTAANLTSDLRGTISTGISSQTLGISYGSSGDTSTADVKSGGYAITGTLANGTGLASDYNVTLKSGTLTVNPYAFTYQISNDTQTYGTAANFASDLGTTINTGVNSQKLGISYSSSGDTTTADVKSGGYALTGSLSNGTGLTTDYTVTLKSGTLTVNPYAFTYQIGNDTQTYGTAANFASDLGTTINTGVNSQNLGIAYSSTGDTTTAHVQTGGYAITGTLSNGTGLTSDYNVTLKSGTLTVNPYAFTYQIGNDSQTYGTAANLASDLSTKITTGVNGQNLGISYSSTGDTTTADVQTGGYAITGTLSNGTGLTSDYSVTLKNGTLTVNPYAYSYTIGNDSQTYGSAANLANDLVPTINTGINSQNLGISYSSTGDLATAGVGTYAITGTLANGTGLTTDYTVTLTNGTLTVNKATLTVTASNASRVYGAANPTFTDTIAGYVNGESSSVVSGAASLTTTATTSSAPGTYSITAALGTLSAVNYTFAFVNGTLTITKDATTTAATAILSAQNVTLLAGVFANSPGSGTPSGSVDFYDTTTSKDLGSVSLTSGAASLIIALPTSSQTITVSYSGDGNFLTSGGTLPLAAAATIYVLNSSASGALTISGNANINVPGGIEVDSTASSAIVASSNAIITATSIQVVGGYSASGNTHFTPKPTTGAASVADPLASLAAPSLTGSKSTENLSGNSSATINPGIYTAITLSGNANLTMNPGIYVIAGGGFTVSGNASVTATGVMIYNAGSAYPSLGGTFGGITLSGNGKVALAAPSSGTYAGLGIFQSRDNTQPLALSGNNITGIYGTIYAANSQLTLSSNAQLKDAIIVGTMNLSGNAIFNTVTSGGSVGYTPSQIRAAYGISSLPLDGTGQTIAIVDAYDDPKIYQAVDVFDQQLGVSSTGASLYEQYGAASSFLTVLNQNGQATALPGVDPSGPGSENWEAEEALDVEWTHAVAPGARILLVEANSQSLSDLMTAVATAAAQPGVSVVSMSWGFAEDQAVFAHEEATYDQYLTTPAGHQGVTFVASTGDYGSADPEYPALSPNVVAVGGTSLSLNANGTYNSETGWGYYANALGTFIGSGGGASQYEAEPSFQQGVQSTGTRTIPDVSFDADPNTGVWIADPYNLAGSNPWEIVGGTSLSAPAWAALIALVDQGRVEHGTTTLGTAGPTETQLALYNLPKSDYHVITSGTNGEFTAQAGYNLVTGLGSPVASQLVPDLIAWSGSLHFFAKSDATNTAAAVPVVHAVESTGAVVGAMGPRGLMSPLGFTTAVMPEAAPFVTWTVGPFANGLAAPSAQTLANPSVFSQLGPLVLDRWSAGPLVGLNLIGEWTDPYSDAHEANDALWAAFAGQSGGAFDPSNDGDVLDQVFGGAGLNLAEDDSWREGP